MAKKRATGTQIFDIANDWVMPDLDDLLGDAAVLDASSQRIDTTYYDTRSNDLQRNGITLFQTHDSAGARWRLTLPDGNLEAPGAGRAVPHDVRDLIVGARGGGALVSVRRQRTERVTNRIASGETTHAEIAIDDVTTTESGESATITERRQVLVSAAKNGWRRRVTSLVARSGAKRTRPHRTIKSASRPPKSLGGLITGYLEIQRLELVRSDLDLRRGRDAIDRAHAAVRRYRSVLRVFADQFDDQAATDLDIELHWYAVVLGEVRDSHALRSHITRLIEDVSVAEPTVTHIMRTIDVEQARTGAALQATLGSRRYLQLLRRLGEWSDTPPMTTKKRKAGAARAYLDRSEHEVKNRLHDLQRADQNSSDYDLAVHHARSAAERTRNTAELAEPVLGKTARAAARKAKKHQRVLRGRHDAAFAAAFLRRLAETTHHSAEAFDYGALWARARDARIA